MKFRWCFYHASQQYMYVNCFDLLFNLQSTFQVCSVFHDPKGFNYRCLNADVSTAPGKLQIMYYSSYELSEIQSYCNKQSPVQNLEYVFSRFYAQSRIFSHIIDVVCGLGMLCEICLGLTRVRYHMTSYDVVVFMFRIASKINSSFL